MTPENNQETSSGLRSVLDYLPTKAARDLGGHVVSWFMESEERVLGAIRSPEESLDAIGSKINTLEHSAKHLVQRGIVLAEVLLRSKDKKITDDQETKKG